MFLFFNTLSRFVIAFLPRSNHLLISWLQSLSAAILRPKKRESVTTSTFSPSICHAVMGAAEKAMTPHSSVLAWRIPGMAEPGGLPSMGLQSQTRLKRLSSSSSSNGGRYHDLVFLIFSLKPALSLSSFTLIKKLFSSSLLSMRTS